ncbi:MAG: hypothetical protein RIQ81_1901 [Pseudomonadota bacterium]|jgi:CRP-like cAMP-binding protein
MSDTDSGNKIRFAPGDVIFQQGEKGDAIYHIEKGTVEVYLGTAGAPSVLAEMGPGEFLGVMAIVTSSTRMASARARTEVVCKKIPAEPFKQQVSQLPEWVRAVFKDYRARLEYVDQLLHKQATELRSLKKKLDKTQEK